MSLYTMTKSAVSEVLCSCAKCCMRLIHQSSILYSFITHYEQVTPSSHCNDTDMGGTVCSEVPQTYFAVVVLHVNVMILRSYVHI